MRFLKFIIPVILLVIIGVVASFLLVPDEETVVVMQERDQVVRNAGFADYQAEYDAGSREETVIVGLSDRYIGEGRGMDAIPMLEEALQTRPDYHTARRKLAELYRAAGRDADFAREVEYLAMQDPSETNLKNLADLYHQAQRFEEQADLLRQLVTMTNNEKPEYMAELAATLILLEKKDEANQVLADLQMRHPDYKSFVLTRILVSNSLDRGEPQQALDLAKEWTTAQPDGDQIADLINLIHYGGEPVYALQLAAAHSDLISASIPMYVAYVNALIGAGEDERAYATMKPVRQQNRLPVELYGVYIEQALAHKELAEAEAVVDELDPKYFDEAVTLNLFALSYFNDYDSITEKLIAKFGNPEFRSNKPVLDAVIAMIEKEEATDAKITVALDHPHLKKTARLRLAQFCAEFNKETCFDTIVARFDPVMQMTAQELNEYVDLHIAADKQDRIVKQVEEAALATDSERVRFAWAKLAAANGNAAAIQAWLERYGRGTANADLSELFYLANDRGHGSAALPVAEMLYERAPNATYREFLISAYMNAGQYAKALPVLRQVRSQSMGDENNYLAALTKLGRTDAQYRDELAEYVKPLLDSDQVSSERKLELVYMLINTRQQNLARPYVKEYAESEGGEWKKTWNQMNNVGGKAVASRSAEPAVGDLPLETRLTLAMDAKTSVQKKRDIAYTLIDDGFKTEATGIFYELAQDQPAQSQDVKDLLFLWGNDLNEEQIAWLAHRASRAQSYGEAKAWTDYIITQGNDHAMMQYITKNPNALSYPGLRTEYLTAMAKYSTGDEFTRGLSGWLNATNDPDALKDYADIATAYGYRNAAVQALRKIDQLAPQNEKVLKDLGVLTFNQADYSESEKYLGAYFNQKQQGAVQTSPFEALFYQAQLLWREGKKQEALPYFQQVLQLGASQANTLERQSMYYTSQFHAGYPEQGKRGFYQLLSAYPGNKSLLADFISVLVEFKYHGEAMNVANQYDPAMRGRMQQSQPAMMAPMSYQKGTKHIVVRPVSSIMVVAQAAPMTAEQRMRMQQELRLQLLYARMELETGREADAIARLNAIKPYFPNDAQLIGFTANAENFSGNWPRALQMLENAQQLTPENEDLTALKRSIEKLHTNQHIKLDHEWRRIGDSDEQITTGEVKIAPTTDTEIGLVMQNDEVDAAGIRRGTTGNIVNESYGRQRGELYIAHYLGGGDRLQASLFANNDAGGAGLYYGFTNGAGRTELLGEYHRPYWDFVEAVVEETTRDRVGLKHVARLGERVTFSGETSVNNYNTSHEDNVASSYLLRGNLVYELQAQHPYLGLGYGFDGEYFMGKKKEGRIDPVTLGQDYYALLPHNAREIHFVSGIIAEEWSSTRAEFIGGYAYDRLGEHGPQAQATLTQEFTDSLEGQVRARYGLQSNDSDQNYTLVGGHLKYKF
jgi:hypothetical protein